MPTGLESVIIGAVIGTICGTCLGICARIRQQYIDFQRHKTDVENITKNILHIDNIPPDEENCSTCDTIPLPSDEENGHQMDYMQARPIV